MPRPSG